MCPSAGAKSKKGISHYHLPRWDVDMGYHRTDVEGFLSFSFLSDFFLSDPVCFLLIFLRALPLASISGDARVCRRANGLLFLVVVCF